MSLRRLLLPLFFLSGISALLYQIVWLKYLGFVFGNTVYAAATLIAVYLAGLGIGAFLFGRQSWPRRPLLAYALVEALIGALAAFSPNAFALIDRLYIASFQQWLDAPATLALARIGAAALVLLPPTLLMGGTLPLLVRAFREEGSESGHAVAALYAANTFGATAGVALAGFFTIPSVGLLTTIFVGVLINFALAAAAALLGFRTKDRSLADAAIERDTPLIATGATFVLTIALLTGLTSIADEVFWSRILVLHLGSSVYAYSLMLFSFLIGLAIGSAIIDRRIARADAPKVLGLLQISLAAVLALQIHYFTRFSDVLEFFARLFGAASYSATVMTFICAVLSALVIPTALMGAAFPLIVRLHAQRTGSAESRSVGVVYLWNTIGSITGSLAAGFLLIRALGSQNGLYATALINLLLGVLLLARSDRKMLGWAAVAAATLLGSFVLARPDQVILSAGLFTDDKAKILVFREDTTATVTLRQYAPDLLSLELNGVNVAGTSADLIGTQKLQGHLPLLMHPGAKSVLHIGFGSGGTAYAVSRHAVSNITIAEISPEVLETSGKYLRQVNHGVLTDPRVKARIADGRNYVLAAPEKFDVILSDSIHPRYAGNGSLYTKDYFELCRKKLNPNGIVSMWLPIYSLTPRNYLMILRAFHDVFPNSTVWYVPNAPNAYTIVIGRTESGPIDLKRMQSRVTPAVAGELAGIGIRDIYDLSSALIQDPDGIAALTSGVEPHVDDLPAVEYESGRIIDREGSWLANFIMLTRSMSPFERAFATDVDHKRMAAAAALRGTRARQHTEWLINEIKVSRGIK
jgi:spermidine synthase